MPKFKINNKSKTVLALVSITGLATASHSGLITQLASALARGVVPAAQAQSFDRERLENLSQKKEATSAAD